MGDNKQVYKYTLEIEDTNTIHMPTGAEILSVQMQYGQPRIWALVSTSAPYEVRTFEVYGTGHQLRQPETLRFVATVQLSDGDLVFHIFERAKA